MKKVLLASAFIFIALVASAATTDWSFTTSSNYAYDSNIEISSGTAKLKTDFFDANWQYRQPVTIDNTSNSNELSDYQVRLKITSSNSDFWSNIESSGDSIRFADSDKSTLLDFWLHDFDYSGQSAEIWIEVPTIEASSSETIYLYYGNSSASSLSNGENTFLFFDDFNDNSIDSTKWTEIDISANEITEAENRLAFTRTTNGTWNKGLICNTEFSRSDLSFEFDYEWVINSSGSDAVMFGWHDNGINPRYSYLVYGFYHPGNERTYIYEDNVYKPGATGNWLVSIDYDIRVRMRASGGAYYEQSTSGGNSWVTNYTSTYSTEGDLKPGFAFHSGTHRFDNARVRKWTDTEPSLSCGAQEGGYYTDNPSIRPIVSEFMEFQTISSLTEVATKDGGEIKYILSNDKGSTWIYYNTTTATWAASDGTYAQANTTGEVNSNIISFPTGDGFFLFKAFLHSDGTQGVELDSVTVQSHMLTPEVSSFIPANGAVNVAVGSTISVVFSHAMDQTSVENAISVVSTLNNNNQSTSETISGTFSWSDVRTVVFTPTTALNKGYTYQVTVSTGAKTTGNYPMVASSTFSFRTVVDHEKGSVFESTDQKAKVELDADALSVDGYVLINRDPINDPVVIASASIQSANDKTDVDGNQYVFPITSSITEFIAYNSGGDRVTDNFDAPATVTLYYDDLDNDGFVDSTTPPAKGADLLIYRLDETNNLWVRVPGSSVDTDSKSVSVRVLHFSVYTLMSSPSLDLNTAYAYPVPFKPGEGHTTITFTNLASECTIRVYTISGSLVASLNETDGDGQYSWNVKNSDGFDLVSGIYMYHIRSANDVKVGKIMVVR